MTCPNCKQDTFYEVATGRTWCATEGCDELDGDKLQIAKFVREVRNNKKEVK